MHARVLFQRGDFGMLSLYNVIQRVQYLSNLTSIVRIFAPKNSHHTKGIVIGIWA